MNSIITQGYGNTTLVPTQGYGGEFDPAGVSKGVFVDKKKILDLYSPVEMMGSDSFKLFSPISKSLDKSIRMRTPVDFSKEDSLNIHTRVSIDKLRRIITNL